MSKEGKVNGFCMFIVGIIMVMILPADRVTAVICLALIMVGLLIAAVN